MNNFRRKWVVRLVDKSGLVHKYLDCDNPKCGFARIKCSDYGAKKLIPFPFKSRVFCPAYHAKRVEEWGEWMQQEGQMRIIAFPTLWQIRVG